MTGKEVKNEAALKQGLSLSFLVREPVLPSLAPKAIVLLHGVGSNEKDLFRLADSLPQDAYVISPRAPFVLGHASFAWYGVDFSSGKPVIHEEQEEESRRLLRSFVREVKELYGIEKIFLGGFSQGAIMSSGIGLRFPQELDGVISFSGRILFESRLPVKDPGEMKHLKVFVSHGLTDCTLPIHYGREARDFFKRVGVQLSYHEYRMDHSISEEVLKDLQRWLAEAGR